MTHNSFKLFQLEHLLVFEFVNSCCRIYVFDKYLYFLGRRQALWVSLAASEAEFQA